MKHFIKAECDVLDKITCDRCGASCTESEYKDHEYATFEANWGYLSSGRDGECFLYHLCQRCAELVENFIKDKNLRLTVRPLED
jgi:hypothetical protein